MHRSRAWDLPRCAPGGAPRGGGEDPPSLGRPLAVHASASCVSVLVRWPSAVLAEGEVHTPEPCPLSLPPSARRRSTPSWPDRSGQKPCARRSASKVKQDDCACVPKQDL
ncbi:unnamed protein product [Prorocentrum cordatum]|uniref:Uncharacterized protein n=1 Tax=Prorocentrum cordatum TaxID=2364126 RepID=A0ABN9Y3S2_9DINO|nr:unnamed protein product [Polarella glacialis]